MAAQERVLLRVPVADSPGTDAGESKINHLLLTAGPAAAATAVLRDGTLGTETPVCEVAAPAGSSFDIYFNTSGGGLRILTGVHLTVTGAAAIATAYTS